MKGRKSPKETKPCGTCGKPMLRGPGHTDYKWTRKKYCNKACWAARKIKPNPSRLPPLEQRPSSDAGVKYLMRDGEWLVPPSQRPARFIERSNNT